MCVPCKSIALPVQCIYIAAGMPRMPREMPWDGCSQICHPLAELHVQGSQEKATASESDFLRCFSAPQRPAGHLSAPENLLCNPRGVCVFVQGMTAQAKPRGGGLGSPGRPHAVPGRPRQI